nr:hypothetical protein CFP56_11796 [Quercus suber]
MKRRLLLSIQKRPCPRLNPGTTTTFVIATAVFLLCDLMANFSTRQWRAIVAVLTFMIFAAGVGLLRQDQISRPLPFHTVIEQERLSNKQNKAQQIPNHDTIDDKKSSKNVAGTTASAQSSSTPASLTKAVIMGALETEDTSWVAELVGWQQAVYRVDTPDDETSPTGYQTRINKGREALPYLTFIIDSYEALPDVMAFVHPHRSGYPAAWHNDVAGYDAVTMLNQLQLPFIERNGYANLRCNWNPGCPDEVRPWREPADLTKRQEHAFPYFYSLFFNRTLEQAREEVEVVATPCCAQFAVARKQVRERSKSEYERIRDLIIETEYDDYTSGRVMEYMWHILFGQHAQYCPAMSVCYCDVYGQC